MGIIIFMRTLKKTKMEVYFSFNLGYPKNIFYFCGSERHIF